MSAALLLLLLPLPGAPQRPKALAVFAATEPPLLRLLLRQLLLFDGLDELE